jgi:hypothetical protein
MKSKRKLQFELKLVWNSVHYTQAVLLLVNDQMGERNPLGKCKHEDEILQNPEIHLSMRTCHLPSSTVSEAAGPILQKYHKTYLSP